VTSASKLLHAYHHSTFFLCKQTSCLIACLIFPSLHNISAYMSSPLMYLMYYWYITSLCRLLGTLYLQKFRLTCIQTYWSNMRRILLPGLGRHRRHVNKNPWLYYNIILEFGLFLQEFEIIHIRKKRKKIWCRKKNRDVLSIKKVQKQGNFTPNDFHFCLIFS